MLGDVSVSNRGPEVDDGGASIEHSHKQRHAAAVETSAKLENQHSEEQELVDQVTSLTTIETPATSSAARTDCCYAMRFVF
jgi:hypothetical protein